MKPTDIISDRWHAAAVYAAALCLLVAPFRGATGLRAGLLVLAVVFIAIVAQRQRDWSWTIPVPRYIGYATGAWALALLGAALWASDRWHQVGMWKGEVLTPLLALFVFYALTKNLADARRWLLALLMGLIGLTAMVTLNLFDPVDAVTMPAFGGIGPYSTWLITLSPLLPLAWNLGSPGQRIARSLTILAVVLILISAFLTTNRAIWICFALMLVVFAWLLFMLAAQDRRKLGKLAVLVIAGGALFAALFFAATELRFKGKPPGDGGTIEMVTHDNRGVIWREAIALIAEKPFTGYGVGRDVLEKTMRARFTEPLDKALFIQGHNIVLNQFLQIGVLGAVLILSVFFSLIHAFAGMLRGTVVMRIAGLCGLLLVTGVFARNMVDDFFIRQNAILFWAIVGMLLGLGSPRNEPQVSKNIKH